jgi:glycosyltransferase involved in cell wall biosynthesis
MKLVGIINEPPFDPISWSGTAKYFFSALDRAGILANALNVDISPRLDWAYRARNIESNRSRWREKYHLDTGRFRSLSAVAARKVTASAAQGVLQVGAWYSVSDRVRLPCFSYHDGNLAVRIRSGHTVLGEGHRAVRRAMQWETDTYRGMSGIFTMSRWLADSFIRDFGVPHSKVHVAGAGINFDSLPQPLTAKRYEPVFLMVGKDFERKGGPILLEAFARVRAAIPAAELILIGPSLASPPDGVTCLGYLSKANPEHLALLKKTYTRAGIYVLPSLYEPFGISLLEAMANSLPCIAANHCAMPEIVGHRETGLIVAPGDAADLARAMIELASSPAMACEFGAAGRAKLIKTYTWDAVANQIKQIAEPIMAAG